MASRSRLLTALKSASKHHHQGLWPKLPSLPGLTDPTKMKRSSTLGDNRRASASFRLFLGVLQITGAGFLTGLVAPHGNL